MPERDYTYYDFTISLCPECLKRVDAKIVFKTTMFICKELPGTWFQQSTYRN